jgi:hypothetical protein
MGVRGAYDGKLESFLLLGPRLVASAKGDAERHLQRPAGHVPVHRYGLLHHRQFGGGVVGTVSRVFHISPNGNIVDLDLGTCPKRNSARRETAAPPCSKGGAVEISSVAKSYARHAGIRVVLYREGDRGAGLDSLGGRLETPAT